MAKAQTQIYECNAASWPLKNQIHPYHSVKRRRSIVVASAVLKTKRSNIELYFPGIVPRRCSAESVMNYALRCFFRLGV